MDIAALSSQTGEALRAQPQGSLLVARSALPIAVGSAGGEGLLPAAVDYARLQARADALAGLATGLRGVVGDAGLPHKLYPPYPPEQQAQMRILAAAVAGLQSVDVAVAATDPDLAITFDAPQAQLNDLGLGTQKLLAASTSLTGGISQNHDRLLAIAQGSFAS